MYMDIHMHIPYTNDYDDVQNFQQFPLGVASFTNVKCSSHIDRLICKCDFVLIFVWLVCHKYTCFIFLLVLGTYKLFYLYPSYGFYEQFKKKIYYNVFFQHFKLKKVKKL